MKSFSKAISLIAAAIILTSCTLIPPGIFASGEVKLLNLSIPGPMREDLPYDVVVTFRSVGEVKITKACFRWLDEAELVKKQSLYCYTAEVSDNARIGSQCWRWLAEGQYSYASPTFCSDVKHISYEDPGRITVSLTSRNLEPYYNTLECYVEFLVDGVFKQSNKVSSRIVIED
ncbi:MAG: hypothetical protein RBS57_09840 [Desulforhabdus sp.]|jgi:hypothetical protein|nr:hypothetical protein [Desulforhabdus sp.]